ncbi:DUF3060 domain-containing protein [Jiangella asiatica]|uniref:DUF3060 domain-containing protein n=1 Tax=Jiangella asiatica TaxID=2530372 RepID=A0A4R5D7S4_9ACTN|nr:DUF3060 domain-containing protein [Jiangella asiatica]TDE07394.1 DUF3060 domain-containing protein [Jiangella asiatica]
MTSSTTRRTAVAVALAGFLALGACSAELRDDADTVATQEDAGTDSTGPDDAATDQPSDEPADEPADESEASDQPSEDSDSTGDVSAFDPDPVLDGLTIKALPDSGEIQAVGAFDCGGQPVTVSAAVDPAILVGDCPEVTITASGARVFLDSEVPADLVVAADDTEVLTGRSGSVQVDGNANALGFGPADTVEVAGTDNRVAFSRAQSVAVPAGATGNQIIFLESGGITVDGDANALGYGGGPAPADNGADNQFASGDEVGEAVTEELTTLQEQFEELAAALR